MADKKPSKRSGAPGGDRPMRRRDSHSEARPDARGKKAAGASFDASKAGKGGKRPSDKRPDAKPARTGKSAKSLPAPPEKTSSFEGERIAKAMARAGVCSRRDAEDWIAAGRVAVNGRTLRTPAVNVTDADSVTIDGAPMQARERTRLFLFHKPAGYVTTAHDPEGRATVFSFLEERHPDLPRLVSVGRLDINTEGLLLLTNDGGLARTLELPATGWTRRYRVRVHGEVDQGQLDALRAGVTIDDVVYAPIEARLERVQGANAWIAVALTEGKNREIKRVMEHLGLAVTRLIRISYGPFQLGDMAEGAAEEVKLKVLRDQLGKSLAEFAGVDFASPLREATPAEAQEKRERTEKRPRKHVSVLRRQREEESETGPRARIERGATADRKGRAVVVERVTPTRRKAASDEGKDSRNARRFEAMRGGPRKPRADEAGFERPARGRGPAGRPEGEGFEKRRARAGEGAERRAHGDVKTSRDHARSRPQDSDGRFERRPPRRDDAGPRDDRAPRRPREGGERTERVEGAGRPRAFGAGPRRSGEAGARDDRAARRPREGGDRPERFDRPPRARSFGAEAGDRPRRDRAGAPEGGHRGARGGAGTPGEDRAPRGAPRKGPSRDAAKGPAGPAGRGGPGAGPRGPGRGPGKDFGKGGAGRGPGKGSGKGLGKGLGKGPGGAPGKGPRKPRG
ncbi:MAG: pseudouridine synthase [Methylocystis sp.]|uniref:pseudouridine synthase n=1 Tax=Methylocystis sp. TaxID=1911079 RepID=UPI003DA30C36